MLGDDGPYSLLATLILVFKKCTGAFWGELVNASVSLSVGLRFNFESGRSET